MTDRETGLLERWRAERPMYAAWGNFVAATLTDAVAREIHPTTLELFLRIPIKPRTKADPSLLAKAFRRGKPYADPYNDIEDKVGLRFVVLVSADIKIVERVVNTCPKWTAVRARDYEEERRQRPYEFDYQSVHYIVRSKDELTFDGVAIAAGTPCEVQVRTILQHAYSELTHDTIYKPSVQASPEVKRSAAKSMALMEATDDYFMKVREWLDAALAPSREVSAAVDRLYRSFTGLEPQSSPLDMLLIDHFGQWAREGFEVELRQFLDDKGFLADRIRERAPVDLLFRQPAVLMVYWAIKVAPRSAPENGPLTDEELAPIYSDLGLARPVAQG
ncbi:RelA/SpoT family protein [Mesorhizobium sp.]|uniref:GTP pyrophosphokinase n=1 Tax=Mesorhizobium sp. TaxID=1871066 RepID=UPI000FE2EF7E|nr:RelA/SpoT family protein [Mesorhizobium sp.]RWN96175.1 MAG: RelA/SpoT family protein [Mesorhizobium sp.]TIN33743.1 MAG: RelA/SpoT family protein [Mesorhizobium sp.]TJU75337.1 MAG: RelA/SpoT family protein [Mesorhizobium sp.]TJU84129.1 MAG: RelA/SpoT family protein [Mesorhizobium sp.]